jgi:hypothetical protein
MTWTWFLRHAGFRPGAILKSRQQMGVYVARFQYRDTCGQVRNFDYGSYPLGVFFAGFAPSCGSRRGLLGIAAQ